MPSEAELYAMWGPWGPSTKPPGHPAPDPWEIPLASIVSCVTSHLDTFDTFNYVVKYSQDKGCCWIGIPLLLSMTRLKFDAFFGPYHRYSDIIEYSIFIWGLKNFVAHRHHIRIKCDCSHLSRVIVASKIHMVNIVKYYLIL